MTYLQNLTLRLATGLGELPEESRLKHGEYLRSAQREDGGFGGREGGSDLYYTGFALRGLALLGQLEGDVAERAAEYLRSKLAQRVPMVDFLSLVYGAMLLELSTDIDVFQAVTSDWRNLISAALEEFRRPDGGYAKTEEGQASSVYHTFLVVLSQQLIGAGTPEPQRIVEFVRSRRREDGGFVEMPVMKRSGTNPTAAAIALLKIHDELDDETREDAIDFLAEMQTDEGGLRANTRIPIADLLSTFTGMLTLADLEASSEIDARRALAYTMSLERPDGGFHGALWDTGHDVEYTFYGLGALALLQEHDGEEAISGQ